MPKVRTPPTSDDARDALIQRQEEEIARFRDALTRAEHERVRLKRRNERLEDQLDAARRAGFRQAAPFAKPHRHGTGRRPGRRAGATYGRHGTRPVPPRIDDTLDAPVPAACPACGGEVRDTHVVSQYQEDLPMVRPRRPRVSRARRRVWDVRPARARSTSAADLGRARRSGGADWPCASG